MADEKRMGFNRSIAELVVFTYLMGKGCGLNPSKEFSVVFVDALEDIFNKHDVNFKSF